jgi:hypothetical protein
MKRIKPILLLTLGIFGGQVSANAQGIINIDFTFPSFGGNNATSYGPGAAVIGSGSDYWNGIQLNVTATNITGLLNNSGNPTSAGYSWVYAGLGGGATDPKLFTPFFDIYGVTNQITGLTPGAQYNLYLYGPTVVRNTYVNGVLFQWNPTSDFSLSYGNGINYDEQTVTSDANGILNITSTDNIRGSNLSALQLTPVATPEPSTFALACLGAASLLAYRHKSNFPR